MCQRGVASDRFENPGGGVLRQRHDFDRFENPGGGVLRQRHDLQDLVGLADVIAATNRWVETESPQAKILDVGSASARADPSAHR
jgi:hypothetical protein